MAMVEEFKHTLMSFDEYEDIYGDALYEWMMDQGMHNELDFAEQYEKRLLKGYEEHVISMIKK
jgi:hypothetical protein